jgi:hypothetical protein
MDQAKGVRIAVQAVPCYKITAKVLLHKGGEKEAVGEDRAAYILEQLASCNQYPNHQRFLAEWTHR